MTTGVGVGVVVDAVKGPSKRISFRASSISGGGRFWNDELLTSLNRADWKASEGFIAPSGLSMIASTRTVPDVALAVTVYRISMCVSVDVGSGVAFAVFFTSRGTVVDANATVVSVAGRDPVYFTF